MLPSAWAKGQSESCRLGCQLCGENRHQLLHLLLACEEVPAVHLVVAPTGSMNAALFGMSSLMPWMARPMVLVMMQG